MRGRLGLDRLDVLGGDETSSDELARHPSDRVTARLVGELLRRSVLRLGVRCRVRVRARDRRVDQRGADAGAHVADDRRGPLADLEVVGAVEPMDVEPTEAADQLGDRRRRLIARRHRDRVAVVGDEEHDRQVERARGVEALPELALGRRSFSERHVGDLVAERRAAREVRPAGDVARRLRASDCRQALSAGRARLRHDVVLDAAPVRRHLASARRRVVRRPDRLEQDLVRADPEPEHERLVAVVREEPVVAGAEMAGEAEQQRLVSGSRDLEEHAALALQVDLAVVDRPRDARPPEVFDELVSRKLDGRCRSRRGRPSACRVRRRRLRRGHDVASGDLGPPISRLEDVLHAGEERRGVRPIIRAVVERHRDVAHRVDGDAVVALGCRDGDRSHRHAIGGDDPHLRLVDDRSGQQRSVAARVRDRERAAGQVVSREAFGVRPLCDVGRRGGQLDERHRVGVPDDGHHQPLEVEVDGDAEVNVAVDDEVVADDRRVQSWKLGERVDDRTGHERADR